MSRVSDGAKLFHAQRSGSTATTVTDLDPKDRGQRGRLIFLAKAGGFDDRTEARRILEQHGVDPDGSSAA